MKALIVMETDASGRPVTDQPIGWTHVGANGIGGSAYRGLIVSGTPKAIGALSAAVVLTLTEPEDGERWPEIDEQWPEQMATLNGFLQSIGADPLPVETTPRQAAALLAPEADLTGFDVGEE